MLYDAYFFKDKQIKIKELIGFKIIKISQESLKLSFLREGKLKIIKFMMFYNIN